MKFFKQLCCSMAIFVTAAIGLTSCSDDIAPDSPKYDGEVNVVLTTSLPSELTTYGTTSAEGGLKNLAGKGYSVRYVMEVYPKGSNEHVVRMINYKPIEADPESARSTSFETRLMAAEYNFVFYADIVREITLSGGIAEGLTTPCYGNRYFFSNKDEASDVLIQPSYSEQATEGSLKSIKATNNADSYYNHKSTEQYDIYTCKENVDLRYENTHSFTLKRPFAKLRIITTDSEELEADKTPNWNQTVVTLQSADSDNALNNEYNAVDGTYSSNGRSYWGAFYQTDKAENTETYNEEEEGGEKFGERTLAVFYLPISNGSYNLDFRITTQKGNTKTIDNLPISVENVPLVANKLTTIKGKLLTKKFVSEIRIDDEFEKDEDNKIDDTVIFYGQEAGSMSELISMLDGSSNTISYTGRINKNDGFTLDFDNLKDEAITTYASNDFLFKDGNKAYLTLNFASVEEGSILIFKGKNAPKNLQLRTNAKCSVLIEMENSNIYFDSGTYKYIVANTECDYTPENDYFVFDAMFYVGNTLISDDTNSHSFAINKDFTLADNVKCDNVNMHSGKTCSFLSTLTDWLNNNSGKTVWDFVEANK